MFFSIVISIIGNLTVDNKNKYLLLISNDIPMDIIYQYTLCSCLMCIVNCISTYRCVRMLYVVKFAAAKRCLPPRGLVDALKCHLKSIWLQNAADQHPRFSYNRSVRKQKHSNSGFIVRIESPIISLQRCSMTIPIIWRYAFLGCSVHIALPCWWFRKHAPVSQNLTFTNDPAGPRSSVGSRISSCVPVECPTFEHDLVLSTLL